MTVLATVAEPFPWGPVVSVVVAVLTLAYLAACAFWPWTAHARCKGTGKLRSPSGRAWRACPGCRGTGKRVRAGRRVWTYVADTRKDAQ